MFSRFIFLVMLLICGCGSGSGGDGQAPYAGVFQASKLSDVYHYPDCPSAKQIYPANLITFATTDLAVTNGYRPCKTCNPPLGRVTSFAPVLTLTSVAPTAIAVNEGGGRVTVRYFINTYDENRDLSSIDYSVTTNGAAITSGGFSTGYLGVKNVTMGPSFYLSTTTAGSYQLQVFATDSVGNRSNVVTANITIQ